VGHPIGRNGGLEGFSNLNATSNWVDAQISHILGNPSTFTRNYLISHLNLRAVRRFLGNSISVRLGDASHLAIEKYLLAYLKKGVKPPEDITPVILNLADDYLNGRALELKAGDLFSLEKYFSRKKKTVK